MATMPDTSQDERIMELARDAAYGISSRCVQLPANMDFALVREIVADTIRTALAETGRVSQGRYAGTTADHAAEIAEGHAITIKELQAEIEKLKADLLGSGGGDG